MTELRRVCVRPLSPWRTPWQADTLTGALCSVAARVHGADFLRQRLSEPMRAGRPPFVLSDAFPGDLLPVPVTVRLCRPPPDVDRKTIKRGRWATRQHFLALRAGAANGQIPWSELKADADVFCEETTRHNTLSRTSNASLEDGGLFARPDFALRTEVREPAFRSSGSTPGGAHAHTRAGTGAGGARSAQGHGRVPNPALNGADWLSIYFRAADDAAAQLLLDLLGELSLTGFGADIATGRGQFEIVGGPEPVSDLDQPPPGANGVVVLSTFQPGPDDPVDGYWEAFPKFGKLGPDAGLSDVRKRTLIMFRPGACFRANTSHWFLGHAIPMSSVLPPDTTAQLTGRGIQIIHPAFGLAVPARVPLSQETRS